MEIGFISGVKCSKENGSFARLGYRKSDKSGWWYHPSNIIEVVCGGGITKLYGNYECADLNYCDSCEKYFKQDAILFRYSDNTDSNLCTPCWILDQQNSVARYHHSSVRKYWPEPKSGDYGIEIEVDSQDHKKVIEICKGENWAVENDSSLGDDGIELISPPMPYDNLVASIINLLPKLPCKGWEAGDGYGIHISFHTGRMQKPHLARIIQFINANPLRLCEFVAGRPTNRHAEFKNKKNLPPEEVIRSENKYEAINVGKLPRAEVRIFRSTTKLESVIANLEFVKSCIEFCREPITQNDPQDAQRYIEFLASHPRIYKNLINKLSRFFQDRNKSVNFKTLTDLFPENWSNIKPNRKRNLLGT